MKKIIFLFVLSVNVLFAQQAYYNDVDLTLTGTALKDELATKITSTHTNNLSYSEAREALRIVDLDPGQNTNVLLVYGYTSNLCPTDAANDDKHRRRDKTFFDNGSADACMWNREHTYPKALGTPTLGNTGPGADAHMLRSCDKKRNGNRANKKFGNGSGNSGTVSSNWYPGDEWKGDMARILMYMYLRYGNQCLPNNACVGSAPANDSNMVSLLLQWNAEDPVSAYEENRNNYLELTSNQYGQGNRNPFIDNPYFATKIWGGTPAEDIWGTLNTSNPNLEKLITVYPNPILENLNIKTNLNITNVAIFSLTGKRVLNNIKIFDRINITHLDKGFYILKITTNQGVLIKKIFKNT